VEVEEIDPLFVSPKKPLQATQEKRKKRYSDPIATYTTAGRRKSVDTGGLALALGYTGDEDDIWYSSRARGSGWGGWEEIGDIEGPL